MGKGYEIDMRDVARECTDDHAVHVFDYLNQTVGRNSYGPDVEGFLWKLAGRTYIASQLVECKKIAESENPHSDENINKFHELANKIHLISKAAGFNWKSIESKLDEFKLGRLRVEVQ